MLATVTVWPRIDRRTLGALLGVVVLVPFISYLTLCAQLRIYALMWTSMSSDLADWLAFALGPTMTMLGITVAIVIFVGLLGRGARAWTREWWTRYGALIGLVGTGLLILMTAAVFAPNAVLWPPGNHQTLWKAAKASGLTAWIGSTVAGLFAGKSKKTGEGGGRSKTLEIVARIGRLVFIAGAVALVSTALYLLLKNIIPGGDTADYWCNLQTIVYAPGTFGIPWLLIVAGGGIILGRIFSSRFDLNTFSLNQFYRDRLVRCYLAVCGKTGRCERLTQPDLRRMDLYDSRIA